MNLLNKRRVAALVIVGAVGCAKSEYPVAGHGKSEWKPPQERKSLAGNEEAPPKILPETYFAAAQVLEYQGHMESAVNQYQKAIAVNHQYVAAHHRLGLLLSRIGQRDEALVALRRAVTLAPNSAVLHNNLGYELMLKEQWEEAERELDRAVAIEPNFARACVNHGMVLSKLGRFDEAMSSFRTVLPESDAQYNLGLMYRGQQRFSEAADCFSRVLSYDPSFTAAQRQLEQLSPKIEQIAWSRPVQTVEAVGPFPIIAQADPYPDSDPALLQDSHLNAAISGLQHRTVADAEPFATLASDDVSRTAPDSSSTLHSWNDASSSSLHSAMHPSTDSGRAHSASHGWIHDGSAWMDSSGYGADDHAAQSLVQEISHTTAKVSQAHEWASIFPSPLMLPDSLDENSCDPWTIDNVRDALWIARNELACLEQYVSASESGLAWSSPAEWMAESAGSIEPALKGAEIAGPETGDRSMISRIADPNGSENQKSPSQRRPTMSMKVTDPPSDVHQNESDGSRSSELDPQSEQEHDGHDKREDAKPESRLWLDRDLIPDGLRLELIGEFELPRFAGKNKREVENLAIEELVDALSISENDARCLDRAAKFDERLQALFGEWIKPGVVSSADSLDVLGHDVRDGKQLEATGLAQRSRIAHSRLSPQD